MVCFVERRKGGGVSSLLSHFITNSTVIILSASGGDNPDNIYILRFKPSPEAAGQISPLPIQNEILSPPFSASLHPLYFAILPRLPIVLFRSPLKGFVLYIQSKSIVILLLFSKIQILFLKTEHFLFLLPEVHWKGAGLMFPSLCFCDSVARLSLFLTFPPSFSC